MASLVNDMSKDTWGKADVGDEKPTTNPVNESIAIFKPRQMSEARRRKLLKKLVYPNMPW